MMLSEEEARKKWCPFGRVHTGDPRNQGPVGNRDDEGSAIGFCIASDCMAWRWKDGLGPEHKWDDGNEAVGFCGLAGTP